MPYKENPEFPYFGNMIGKVVSHIPKSMFIGFARKDWEKTNLMISNMMAC